MRNGKLYFCPDCRKRQDKPGVLWEGGEMRYECVRCGEIEVVEVDPDKSEFPPGYLDYLNK